MTRAPYRARPASAFLPKKRNKYGATKVPACASCFAWHIPPLEWTGACMNCKHTECVTFDSKSEARRHGILHQQEKTGRISELEIHPKFPIVVNGIKIAVYESDFRYRIGGSQITEDVKSSATRTPLYRIKRKLVEALYPGTRIVEIT